LDEKQMDAGTENLVKKQMDAETKNLAEKHMDKGAQNLDEKQCPREWPKDEVAEGDET
jgi:hypothetical protein